MDLNRLSVFLRIVEEHGVTLAAKKLNLPKSSVSRSLKLLEQEIGTELLRRSSRKLTLTDAGARLFTEASRALASIHDVEAEIVDLDAAVRGPIRITAPVDAGVWLLAPLLGEFSCAYPEVRLELSLSGRVVDLVSEGYDIAVRAGQIRDTSLIARPLARASFVLVASSGYLKQHGVPKSAKDLQQHRCVLFREFTGTGTWILDGPNGTETLSIKGAVVADDFSFMRALVLAGGGIALLPSFLYNKQDAALVHVLPKYSGQAPPLHVVYPQGKYMPRRVVLFRDFLLKSLGGKPIAKRA